MKRFVQALSRVLDITGAHHHCVPLPSVEDALAGDWAAVGDGLRAAMAAFDRERKGLADAGVTGDAAGVAVATRAQARAAAGRDGARAL